MSGVIGGESITIRSAPLVVGARYNAKVRNWAAASDVESRGWSVQPYQATEANLDREFLATHVRAFGPYDAPVNAWDRVVFNGTVYEVDGEPESWRDDQGTPSHVVLSLKKLEG